MAINNSFYLANVPGSIILNHTSTGWLKGGIIIPYSGNDVIVGIAWDVNYSGVGSCILKRMSHGDTDGPVGVPGLWGPTSDNLPAGTYIFGTQEAFNNLADSLGAREFANNPKNMGASAAITVDTWAGFQFGWAPTCQRTASLTNFRAIYKVTPPSGPSEHESGAGNTCDTPGDIADPTSPNPIRIRRGDKLLSERDLIVNSPTESLGFTRAYVQSKQNHPQFQFMGLGWMHNHAPKLILDGTAPNRNAQIILPNGGVLKLDEDSNDPGHFDPKAGSNTVLDAVGSGYLLTSPDKSQRVFEADPDPSGTGWRIQSRTWPNGDAWTYLYNSTTYHLEEVSDDYGNKLVFEYYASGDHAGQLYRVGDQTYNNTISPPLGRYVQYEYSRNKVLVGGTTIQDGTQSLLSVVEDVRRKRWEYLYNQTDSDHLNFLMQRRSPLFEDELGQPISNSALGLESLEYTLNGTSIASLTQWRGLSDPSDPQSALIRNDLAFNVSGNTTHKVANSNDLVTTYLFSNGVYQGVQNPLGEKSNILLGSTYRPFAQVDANGNTTSLNWQENGKQLQGVVDAAGYGTTFEYDNADDNRLIRSVDAQGRITEYTYGSPNAPRQPTVIKVYDSDGTTVLHWQEYTYENGRTTAERLIDPSDGVTPLQETLRAYYTSGDGNGLLQSITQTDIDGSNDVTTTYTYDSAGRVVQVNQNTTFGNCSRSRTVYDAAGNVIASLCNFEPGTINPIYPTTVAQAQELRQRLYDDQNADHYTDPNTNRLTLHVYDTLGRRVQTIQNAEDLDDEQITLTFYDALSRVVRTISNYDPQGSSAPGDWVWNADATPEPRWEDGSGNAIDHGTDNTKNIIADTDYNARGMVRFQRDVLGNVTLLGYNDAGRLVKTIRNASDQEYNNDYIGPSPDPDLSGYTFVSDPDQDIITLNEYDPVGNLVKTTDPLGQVSFTVYDALNRPVKTVRNAHANATVSLNPGDVGYDAAHDPRAAEYAISADPDRDHISTTEYDSLGRVIRTQQLLENRDSTAAWMTTLYGYDTLGRQVKSIRSASQPNYNIATDPDLSDYVASSAADLDIISTTTYNVEGRLLAVADVNGTLARSVYDGLGRPVRTIASYSANTEDPANWVWDATDNQWEQSDGTAIAHGSDNDENIISHTVYDNDGRVLETVDVLGRVTHQVYDDLGRQVRTVSNYVDNSYADPADWVWESGQWKDAPAGTIISRGDHYDQNIVSTTEYDDQGRVWKTFDQRYNESRMVYDTLGRRIMTIANYVAQGSAPENWLWDAGDARWEDGAGNAIDHGSANDVNQISTTTYDIAGRVTASRDNAGLETRYEYDALGRQVKIIRNYVDGVYTPAAPDEDLVSETLYNKAGQVIATVDPRGTQTTFTYDAAGRRLSVIQAAGTPLSSQSYTCYDKAGRVRRSIQNYLPLVDAEDEPILPDTYAAGIWAFNPTQHGPYQDQNLITEFVYDAAGRQVQVIDPVGNTTATSYTKDGQVDTMTDAEGVETLYRYDQLRRRKRVVQSFVAQGSNDPAAWVWNKDATPEPHWEDGSNNALNHGSNSDQNIIVDVTYDTAGRMLSLRNSLGHVTTYSYDALNRRLTLTNPLDQTWATDYVDLPTGGTQVKQTYPGLSTVSYIVERDFDQLGRLSTINYDSPTTTPSVRFSYDAAGNRQAMTEYGGTGFTNPMRETVYSYDALHRLTSVGFDTDGDSTVEETVSYAYDAGGLRTRLTLPGNLDITYLYDAKGQLVSLTDWDNQQTQMSYDQVGRHIATRRANGLRSRYSYDAASRLRKLRHSTNQRTLGHFEYQVDKRGNRTQALEVLPHPATTSDTLLAFDDASLIYTGSWSDSTPFKVTDSPSSTLKTLFYGSQIEFTFGTGPDHGLFDVYIGKTLYQSYDGYAATPGERTESVSLTGEGPFLFEIRNRPEHNANATGYQLRFKQLLISDVAYDLHTIDYTYDALSRLQQADYNSGERVYDFDYDLAGNRLQEALSGTGVAAKTTDYEYNAANQIDRMRVDAGTWADFTYDNNGNLTGDGVNAYTWDRANRLLEVDNGNPAELTAYIYNGMGNRIAQAIGTSSPVVTQYLLDTQPGLTQVLAQTTGAVTDRFIHSPRGIHAHQHDNGDRFYSAQDGLGSVRSMADDMLAVQGIQHYAPYGSPFGVQGSLEMPFGFTGEQTDANELVYLRARYLSPQLGVFASLDPFEGMAGRPMSLNGYSWVEGNVANWTDPSGEILPLLIAAPIIAAITAIAYNVFVTQGAGGVDNPNRTSLSCIDWGLALRDAAVALPIGLAFGVAPGAAAIGGATSVAARLLFGDGNVNPQKAAVDLYIGVVFGGIAGGFFKLVPPWKTVTTGAGGGAGITFTRTASQFLARAFGFGTINAIQGVTTNAAYEVFFDEKTTVFENALGATINFATGFLGQSFFDAYVRAVANKSGLLLNRASGWNTSFSQVEGSLEGAALAIIATSNMTRPGLENIVLPQLTQSINQALEEAAKLQPIP